MLCHVLFALLAAVCAAQRWDVQSFQGPNQQSVTINYSQSQCFGLARRSRQAQVQIPTLYNIKTKQISPIPQALYNADQSVIAKLESDGWVVRNQRAFMPQLTYERVQICCPWDQNCDQNQPIQDSPDITANSPCVNGGQLTFEDGQQKCRCPTGNVKYVGKLCHIQETSQTVAPNPSSGPAIPVTTTYGRYGDMAVQDAEILRQQQRLMSQASNRPVIEPRQSPITASYDPWAQQAALWHQQALRAKFAQLEELYRRTQGQLPPGMIQAAYAIRQELQQQERGPGNPYSNFQDSPYINSMANQMQGDQPSQGARVPEARTPWDLDPFGQQQNPVFMNDPRATRVRAPEGFNNDRQILALAVYKHILNQQRARLAAGSPIKSVNQPIPTQDHSKSPNPVPQPQQPSVEPPQMQAPYDITQMRQCLAKVEPKLNACFQTYDVTVEQFISPVFIEKSRNVCQNGNTVGQCIQSLEMACGEAAAPTTRQMVSSVLRTMSMVCQEIMARELPQEQQQQPAQGQQEMPTPEEQQLMIECQKVLEPVLNDCLKEYDITIDQFMNPQYMSKAQALCDDNTAVGQCIMQMDKVCGDYSQKTTKKMIHSILGMMGMVCKHIQERGGDNKISPTSGAVPIKGQPILEEKAPIDEPPMSKTIQQQPELGVPLQNQSQTEGQGEQPMHTEEEQKIMHQCQPVLQSKLNECLQQHGVTIQEFINPEYIDKARNVCQDSIAVGHCLRQLDKTCGDGAILVTRKVLTSILQMMGVVCQKIQARETSAPSQQQPQTQESQDDLSVPTQEEQQLMQQCQPVLQNKLNECLQQHGVTVQEFINPEHIDKSRKVCQDNGAVSQCILQLDKSCGETATVTTRKMLTTILRMMGMVCQQIQAHGDQPKPSVPAQSVQEQQEQQQHQVPKDGQAHIPGNAPHNGEHNQPTPQELESMKKCQASLEPRLNECLKGHSLTIEQFVNPDFMDKSRALCKDSNAVGECIMKLDTVCGQDMVDTTRKMIHSILSMMGGVCQKIMSLGEQGVPTSSQGIPRGPLLRSGGMPPNTPAQSKGNDVKSPLPNLASKQVPTSEDMLPSADVSNNNVPSQQDVEGASAKANTGHDTADYVSRDLEIFGYPLWLIITLILILVVLLLLFVMVTCLCVRRRRRQKKVVITKEIEKMPIPIDEKMCTVGIPPPSYTTTAVQQNEDGLALPPLDIGEDSVSVNLDESFNEKPPLYEDETADDNGKN